MTESVSATRVALPRKGLIAAAFTPMNSDGTVNLRVVGAVVDHLAETGIAGIYVCGTTGEGQALTVAERRLVAQAFVDASGGRLPIIVHVGHNSLLEARELADHAQEVGADAISAMLPWHMTLGDAESAVECLALVAGGAPNLPFVFYHMPSNNPIDVVELAQGILDAVPSAAAVKFTDSRTHLLQSFLDITQGRIGVFFGVDEMLASGLTAGASAAIGSTYNFAAPLNHQIMDSVRSGDLDMARAKQARAVRLIRAILSHGGLAAQKEVMAIIGIDCGPTRLPHTPLTRKQSRELRSSLEDMGFPERIARNTK